MDRVYFQDLQVQTLKLEDYKSDQTKLEDYNDLQWPS